MMSRNMSCTRAWLISTWGISEVPSGTSCTRATRVSGCSPGAQKVVSLIQTDSRMTLSAKPKAWNISIERTLMPSAWPFSIGPSLGSTSMVRICGTRASWAASVRPAGPEPAISTSTGGQRVARLAVARGGRQHVGVAGVEAVDDGIAWCLQSGWQFAGYDKLAYDMYAY